MRFTALCPALRRWLLAGAVRAAACFPVAVAL
jgi:hypothetical protein